jgi:hypothetical protein
VTAGLAGDTPAVGDYDGDGRSDAALFRPSDGTWTIVPSSTGTPQWFAFGQAGDKPAPADYDGDGKADVAVWRPSNLTF